MERSTYVAEPVVTVVVCKRYDEQNWRADVLSEAAWQDTWTRPQPVGFAGVATTRLPPRRRAVQMVLYMLVVYAEKGVRCVEDDVVAKQ